VGFGRRRYYRQASLGGTLLTLVVVAILFVLESGRSEQRAEAARPPPIHRVASVIEPGLPAIQLLQRAGTPACRERSGDEERWIFTRSGAVPDVCAPAEGDLVVIVREERVVQFTPEHGRSQEVTGPADMAAFQRRYGNP
jgi:hypothetical protein